MSTKFDKAKWKAAKSAEFVSAMNGSVLGKHKSIVDRLKQEYDKLLDNVLQSPNSTNETKANNELKLKKSDRFFTVFAGVSLFIVDTLTNVAELHDLPIDISGSSMDEGNDTLYFDIEKNQLALLLKSFLGETAEALTMMKVLKFVNKGAGQLIQKTMQHIDFGNFSITDAIVKNHAIIIDYRNIDSDELKERKYIIHKADKIFDFALDSHWNNIKSDMDTLDRVIFAKTEIPKIKLLKAKIPIEFIFYRNNHPLGGTYDKTLEFRNGKGENEEKVISVLKRVNRNYIDYLQFNENPQKLLANYYANYGSDAANIINEINTDEDISDGEKAAAYALKNLKGYVLKDEMNDGKGTAEYLNRELYSEKHLNARANFFETFIKMKTMKEKIDFGSGFNDIEPVKTKISYMDTATGEFIQANDGFPIKNIVFVNGDYETKVGRVEIYGYSDDNKITATRGDVHVEGGLGSDTITTGSGDDTIYTNAAIDDRYDQEDNSVNNIVRAGSGNDTIYGSKGMDEIYGEDDDDTIYGKDGDDKLDGGKGNNWIFAGKGSDTININADSAYTNHIYTHTDSKDGEDRDDFSNENHVTITQGYSFLSTSHSYIYGGRGKDVVTITGGVSTINLGDGNNVVTIKDSKGSNKITTGSGNDTINIIGEKDVNEITLGGGNDIVNIGGAST